MILQVKKVSKAQTSLETSLTYHARSPMQSELDEDSNTS